MGHFKDPWLSAAEYLASSDETRDKVLRIASQILADDFVAMDEYPPVDRMPYFRHRRSNLPFAMILGGQCRIGLSKEDEERVKSMLERTDWLDFSTMQPDQSVSIEPFLMTVTPVTIAQLSSVFKIRAANDYDLSSLPAWASHEVAVDASRSLGLSLPREDEWEYACRATSESLVSIRGSTTSRTRISKVDVVGLRSNGGAADESVWTPSLIWG